MFPSLRDFSPEVFRGRLRFARRLFQCSCRAVIQEGGSALKRRPPFSSARRSFNKGGCLLISHWTACSRKPSVVELLLCASCCMKFQLYCGHEHGKRDPGGDSAAITRGN